MRRRRFGSPPGVHQRNAALDARRAVKLARRVENVARNYGCKTALGYLVTASRYAGIAASDARAAGSGPLIAGRFRTALRISKRADSAVERAREKYRAACVVKRGR